MAFSVLVEMLNMRMRKRSSKPVELHERYKQPINGARPIYRGLPFL